MKITPFALATVCLLASLFLLPRSLHADDLRPGDLQITVQRERPTGKLHPTTLSKNSVQIASSEEDLHYKVTVRNGSIKSAPAATAKYIIFVHRQQLGEKDKPGEFEKIKGTASLDAIASNGNASFVTDNVTLKKQGVVVSWYYPNGGLTKAQDSIEGIWVKIMDGDKMIGELKSPTTLNKKCVWED